MPIWFSTRSLAELRPIANRGEATLIQHSFPVTRVRRASDILALERDRFSPEIIDALKKKGHNVGFNAIFGNMNMIMVDPKTGSLLGGVDPRQEGYAVGW